MTQGVKGMVLAAGFGQRLRPLTNRWPKPLIPFLGTSPLALAMVRLKQAGIQDVAVNTHYLAEKIDSFLRTKPFGLNNHISYEKEILGTGGCYNPIKSWLGRDHLLVLNGDIVANIDLHHLLETHFQTKALATMALLPEVIPGENGFQTKDQRVVGFGNKAPPGTKTRNFACAQVLSPEFLDRLPKEGFFCIIQEGYRKALAEGLTISSTLHKGLWHDLRDPKFYLEAVLDVLEQNEAWGPLGLTEALANVPFQYRSSTPQKGPAFAIGKPSIEMLGPHVVYEAEVSEDQGTDLERAVALPGASLKQISAKNVVILGDQVISASSF